MMMKTVCCLVLLGVVAAAPQPDHSIQKRQTTVSDITDIARIFDPASVSLTTVGGIILVLLALDVVFTVVFATAFAGRSRQDYSFPIIGNLVNSIDVVEAALTYTGIEEEACKYKAVCKAEYAAINNPLAKLAINTINSNLNGLNKYGSAVAAGLNGEDCDLLYAQCPEHVGFF